LQNAKIVVNLPILSFQVLFMNKNYAFFLILLLCTEWGFAQRRVPSKAHKVRCFTVQSMQAARKRNPKMITDWQFENWLQEKNNARKVAMKNVFGANTELGTINNYTLPIVFHIIHSGEAVGTSTNVSKDLVNKQVMQLNKDYANLSGSPYAAASKTGIQFALATKSPTGATLAEPGIDRISYKTKKFTAPPYDDDAYYITDSIKPATIWDPSKYVNIWVMDMSASGILGFATFPSTTLIEGLDDFETNTDAGVVIDPTTLGNIFATSDCGGSSATAYSLGRTLTHELGHFFGLRHIWGDSTCATDFCGDTPIHEDANYGKPAHPKANSCGTADEMFENFMDYTDDQVTNTFTLNQVERIQTILQNSVRRKSLASSTVPTVAPAASNIIAFANCTGATTVVETAPAGNNRYKDISLPINVENAAIGAATLTIATSGDAVAGQDYQLITPTVSFAAGDFTQSIIVRILDNNKVDGQRKLGLSYTINGSGVTAATYAQSMSITINDDDDIIVGQNTINLLEESFGAGTIPTGWSTYDDGSTSNRFVVGNKGSYLNNAYVTGNSTTKPNTYANSVGYAILETPVIDATRVKALGNLQFKYTVRGRNYNYNTSTGVTTGHYGLTLFALDNDPNGNVSPFGSTNGKTGYGPYSNTSAAITGAPSLSASFLNNTRFYVDFYWNIESAATVNNPALNVDDVIITATPFPVESTVSKSYSHNLVDNTTHNFRSTNNNALLQITKAIIPLENVTASVVEAGSDKASFTTLDGTFFRSRKVVTVSNPTNDQSVLYTVTLYFTTEEVAVWGANATALKIIQLKGNTNFSNTLSNDNAVLLKPNVSDNRTNNGYIAYTVTTTGMGSFALVDIATTLPVSILSFKGTISNSEAVLVWNTANEVNNKGFSIQRSTDGIAFNAIGFVAAGTESAYSFVDKTIKKGSRYYYRLVQTDNNGTISYSTTISLVYIDGNRSVSVLPNPFKHNLTIKNTSTDRSVLGIVITDINGRTMYTHSNFSTSSLDINTASWSKGAYLVRIMSGTSINVLKIVKE
jgi:zinc-dependent metalloproteinase lipoprotein